MSEPTTGPVHDAQVALVSAIQKRTWEAAGGIMVPGGGPVNEAIRAFHAAIEREAYAKVRAAVGRHEAHFHCDSCMSEVLAAIDALMEENDGR